MRLYQDTIDKILCEIDSAFITMIQSPEDSDQRDRSSYTIIDTIDVAATFDIFVNVAEWDLYNQYNAIESSYRSHRIDLPEALDQFQKLVQENMTEPARCILDGTEECGLIPLKRKDLDKALNFLIQKIRFAFVMYMESYNQWRKDNALDEIEVTYKASHILGIFEDEYGYDSLLQCARNARPKYQRDQSILGDVTQQFLSLLNSYLSPFGKAGLIPSYKDIEEDEL